MKPHKTIYLDYAAATPVDSKVKDAMEPYFSERFFNPSATYLAARSVQDAVKSARAKIAQVLGAKPNEIVFTAGGTEANNLAIQGVMQAFPSANLVVSAVEHESVLKPAENFNHKTAKVLTDGNIDLKDLEAKIDNKTVLISIMLANNEIGTIEPINEVAKLVKRIRQQRQTSSNNLPLYLHTDACQAAAYLDLHVNRLGVDLMTINGGKIYGPKQSGFLYVKSGVKLKPQILGGGQERGLRSGTENVPSIVGLATALELVQSARKTEVGRLSALQKLFFDLVGQELPQVIVNGPLKRRLPNNVHISLPGQDNERLMIELDERGIICAAGSACSASSEEPSHVLHAIGLTQRQAQESLRFSMGKNTKDTDIHKVVQTLKSLV